MQYDMNKAFYQIIFQFWIIGKSDIKPVEGDGTISEQCESKRIFPSTGEIIWNVAKPKSGSKLWYWCWSLPRLWC